MEKRKWWKWKQNCTFFIISMIVIYVDCRNWNLWEDFGYLSWKIGCLFNFLIEFRFNCWSLHIKKFILNWVCKYHFNCQSSSFFNRNLRVNSSLRVNMLINDKKYLHNPSGEFKRIDDEINDENRHSIFKIHPSFINPHIIFEM